MNPHNINLIWASSRSYNNNNLTILNDGVFEKFVNLEELGLSGCGITQISAGAFRGLTNLKNLFWYEYFIRNTGILYRTVKLIKILKIAIEIIKEMLRKYRASSTENM